MNATLFVVAALLSPMTSLAQTPTPTATPEEPSTVHDDPKNDPSIGPNFRLHKTIKQMRLLYSPIGGALADGIDNSYNEAKLRYDFSKRLRNSILNPELQKLWKIHSHRYVPAKENGPSFINSDPEYKGISDLQFGNCWGMATLVRYFNVLAFFDPSLPRVNDLDFYKRKIQSVLSGEATVIPGFANFREFSLKPHIELTLKLAALELWRSRAARGSSLKIFKHSDEPLYQKEVEALLTDLQARLDRGESPKVTMSSIIPLKENKVFGLSADIHVMPVYKIERFAESEIQAKIYVWDINFYAETLTMTPKTIDVYSNFGLMYEPWYEPKKPYGTGSRLVHVGLTPDNDPETAQMLRSLRKFCSDNANLKYCVENSPY